jgi:hypothetical protein
MAGNHICAPGRLRTGSPEWSNLLVNRFSLYFRSAIPSASISVQVQNTINVSLSGSFSIEFAAWSTFLVGGVVVL